MTWIYLWFATDDLFSASAAQRSPKCKFSAKGLGMPSYFQLAQPVRRPTRRTVRRRTAPPAAAEIICGALADRGIRADEFAERSALPKETAMAVLNGSVPVTRCIY